MRSTTSCIDQPVPVIFITAFPERLLTGERPGADLPRHQAVQPGHGEGADQPGAVLRPAGQGRRLSAFARPHAAVRSVNGTIARASARFASSHSKEIHHALLGSRVSGRRDHRRRARLRRHRRTSAGIAQILFFIFLAFLVISLLAGLFRRAAERPRSPNLKTDPLKRFSASAGPCPERHVSGGTSSGTRSLRELPRPRERSVRHALGTPSKTPETDTKGTSGAGAG